MKVHSLEIKDFMAIGGAKLSMNDKGLVLIQGENGDDPSSVSNGAGKSSIPDALSWCLFGATARGVTGDAIINRNAKNARVEIVLDDGGDTYRVIRTRKHPKHKNRLRVEKYDLVEAETPAGEGLDHDWADLTKGTDKDTQELVNKIVGCDLQVFNAAVYQGQERMPDLPSYTDKQLKELVEEAAGITILQDCYAEARTEMREAEAKVTRKAAERDAGDKELERLRSSVDALNRNCSEWADSQKVKRAAAQEAVEEQEAVVVDLNGRWKKAKEKLPAIQAKIDQLQEALKKRDEYATARGILEREERDASRLVASAEANYTHAKKRVVQLKAELGNAKDKIGTDCDSCGKEIESKDIAGVVGSLEVKIDAADKERLERSDELRKAQQQHDEARKNLTDYEAGMPDFTVTAEKLGELKNIKTKIENLFSSLDTAEKGLGKVQARVIELDDEKNPYEDLLANAEKETDDQHQELKKIRKELRRRQAEYETCSQVVEVFSPAGVRAHILDHVTPFLNSRTAHYLSVLSDAHLQATWSTLSKTAKGELREKFCIEVSNTTGGQQFGLLSGGEKRKVRLACAMALQDVVSGRALKPIDLFMADEIDDALDEAGLERLMALLDEKARERGTVLVISHRSLSDWIREVCVVKKEKGKSTLSGALVA